MLKNVYVELSDTTYEWEEAKVFIDPTGFIVVEGESRRMFFKIDDVTQWGYEFEEEHDTDPGNKVLKLVQ
jgi:hypothetical protein